MIAWERYPHAGSGSNLYTGRSETQGCGERAKSFKAHTHLHNAMNATLSQNV